MIKVILSHPTKIENEASFINQMFKEGMRYFHLRKPDYSEDEIRDLMQQISSSYYPCIAFHQHHQIAKEFKVKRLHYTEAARKNLRDIDITMLKAQLFHLSTSVHSFEEYKSLMRGFDYAFAGPVFDSISKHDYKAGDIKNTIHVNEKHLTKLIAIGGITKNNCKEAMSYGFDGVAVLGSIWQSNDPVQEFIQLSNEKRS